MQKEINPNEEIIEEKGVKVLIDPKAIMYLLGTEMDYKEENFPHNLYLKIPMRQSVVDVVSPLKFNRCNTFQILLGEACVQSYKFLETLIQCRHQFDHQ